jgi:hypothetical protein
VNPSISRLSVLRDSLLLPESHCLLRICLSDLYPLGSVLVENVSISSKSSSFYLYIDFRSITCDPMDFIGISCDTPFFISNLGVFLPSSQIG